TDRRIGFRRARSRGEPLGVKQALEQRRCEVALAGIRRDYDDGRARVLRPPGEAHRGRAAGNAGDYAVLARQASSVERRRFVADLLDGVDQRKVERFENEAGAEAPELVRLRLQRLAAEVLGEDLARGRLNHDGLDRLALGLFDIARVGDAMESR